MLATTRVEFAQMFGMFSKGATISATPIKSRTIRSILPRLVVISKFLRWSGPLKGAVKHTVKTPYFCQDRKGIERRFTPPLPAPCVHSYYGFARNVLIRINLHRISPKFRGLFLSCHCRRRMPRTDLRSCRPVPLARKPWCSSRSVCRFLPDIGSMLFE